MGDLFRILQAVIRSFADRAPSGSRLLFKTHPIDNGLRDWSSDIAHMAERCGITHQVDVIDGGDLTALIRASRGLVTVNSTVGLTALQQAIPVMALAPAIYDVPGLTHQQNLASFWQAPELPDATLLNHLIHAMTATIQLPGGFIGKQAVTDGATAMADRLLAETKPLAHEPSPERSRFRYESELLELEARALG